MPLGLGIDPVTVTAAPRHFSLPRLGRRTLSCGSRSLRRRRAGVGLAELPEPLERLYRAGAGSGRLI
jgi:hypothetical protein